MDLNKENFGDVFKYPNREEVVEIIELYPRLRGLSFKWIEISGAHHNEIEAFTAFNNLPSWHTRLNNKLGKLEFSFIQAAYHFSKGIPDSNLFAEDGTKREQFFPDFSALHKYRKFLFNFFSESFYYHYSSTLDIISHLLYLYLNIKYKGKLHFDERTFKEVETRNINISQTLREFNKGYNSNRKIRNDFAHNYPITEVDTRSRVAPEENPKAVIFGSIEYTESKDIIEKMDYALTQIVQLLRKLEEELKK